MISADRPESIQGRDFGGGGGPRFLRENQADLSVMEPPKEAGPGPFGAQALVEVQRGDAHSWRLPSFLRISLRGDRGCRPESLPQHVDRMRCRVVVSLTPPREDAADQLQSRIEAITEL